MSRAVPILLASVLVGVAMIATLMKIGIERSEVVGMALGGFFFVAIAGLVLFAHDDL